jgi:anaphase-promoting complex subunit 2
MVRVDVAIHLLAIAYLIIMVGTLCCLHIQLELDVMEEGPNGMVMETKEFTCSPFQATLISHFEDKKQWTSEELSDETGVPVHVLQKRMAFWVTRGVIKVVQGNSSLAGTGGAVSGGNMTYQIAHPRQMVEAVHSNEAGNSGASASMSMYDPDEDGPAVSMAGQEEEEMDVYVSYIVGMLTRLGQLSLKTIHNNLKTHVTGSDIHYNKTPQQLAAFLQLLCRQERLECGPDGMYKLYKR